MASIQPIEQSSPKSPIFERPITTSIVRFNLPHTESEHSPNLSLKEHSIDTNDILSQPTVKISEFQPTENTSFQQLTPKKIKSKKLHRFILLTYRTICSLSLLSILSIVIVLIGFGIVVSYRRSSLNSKCSSISYCPKNSSYTLTCNLTSEYCSCYDFEDQIIGCIQQRTYSQACYRSQECSIEQNLQCNLHTYQCQCLDHYYYNGSFCVPLLTYGELCLISNDRCDYSLNLTCLTTNQCLCNTNQTFWNGEFCEFYRSVDDPCDPYKIPSGCSLTFACDNLTATCQCPSSTYFDGEACLKYSSYLEPCYDSFSCRPNSQLLCSWGLCICDDEYFYWSSIDNRCIYPKKIAYNSSCDYQTTCESDYGLRCINGRCLCELNSYWTPGNYCDVQSQFGEQCVTAPCLAHTDLICSANTCTCPDYYYWDGNICQYQRTYTGFCLNDNWCRSDLGLRCRNLVCTCSLCSTCFWDGVRCRDCPTSWQIVQSNGTIQPRVYCYIKINFYLNWNDSLDTCSSMATSYFGPKSHLIYIDDTQELEDVSSFSTNEYYDIFIGHTNQYNISQWMLANGTKSSSMKWCPGVSTNFTNVKCARILISSVCITDIACSGWTSRYICELD